MIATILFVMLLAIVSKVARGVLSGLITLAFGSLLLMASCAIV